MAKYDLIEEKGRKMPIKIPRDLPAFKVLSEENIL